MSLKDKEIKGLSVCFFITLKNYFGHLWRQQQHYAGGEMLLNDPQF